MQAQNVRLKSLTIERQVWGEFEGQLIGKIQFEAAGSSVTLHINQETAIKLLAVVQEGMVAAARDAAAATAEAVLNTVMAAQENAQKKLAASSVVAVVEGA